MTSFAPCPPAMRRADDEARLEASICPLRSEQFFDRPLYFDYRTGSSTERVTRANGKMRVRVPSGIIEVASCPSLSRTAFDGSQDWVIAHNDVVAGSSPASGTKCRSSSVVEHVIPSSFLIRRYTCMPTFRRIKTVMKKLENWPSGCLHLNRYETAASTGNTSPHRLRA